MIRPARLHMRRSKGFNLQAHSQFANALPAVLATRPGAFGNPFYIGGYHKICRPQKQGLRAGWKMMTANPEVADASFTHVTDAATSVALYREFLRLWGPPKGIEMLRRVNLACFCKLCDRHAARGKRFDEDCPDCPPCHADILGRLAIGRCEEFPSQ